MKPFAVLSAITALCAAVVLAPKASSQQRSNLPIPAHLYLRAAAASVETPQEEVARLDAEYQDALTRANTLSARLDVMLADAKIKNDSILQRTKPICDKLDGSIDDSGTCIFTCTKKELATCDAKTNDFNQQAAPLIQEKQATLSNLKTFASLVRAMQTLAATKKQALEQKQAQLEKH